MGVESPQLDSKFCPDGGLRFALVKEMKLKCPLKRAVPMSTVHRHHKNSGNLNL